MRRTIVAAMLTTLAASSACAFDENAPLPEGSWPERLAYVSQLDELDETTADYARCSCAASLSAYLLLGGDFAALAEGLGVPAGLTYRNVHLVQERLYELADVDGEPGIYGSLKPVYDDEGKLVGERRPEGEEYHRVAETLGLEVALVTGPTRDEAHLRAALVEELLAGPEPVVFTVGVDEDMEAETFGPRDPDDFANHYVLIFRDGDRFLALDSFRTPGNKALVELTAEQVRENLLETWNPTFALTRPRDR